MAGRLGLDEAELLMLLRDLLLEELSVLGKELSVLGPGDRVEEDDVAVVSLRSRERRAAAVVI